MARNATVAYGFCCFWGSGPEQDFRMSGESVYVRRVCEEECVRMNGESEGVRWKHIKKTRVLEGSPPVHNDCHKNLDFSNDVHH